ncbi:DUF3823 domain-containing protein, partial [Bacteroidales bacterium OttesenSCG-928-I14]|nr:DUF3823 domain-containing protein [Bacteroidales bacterium OttesenSCG-928-I14]
MMCKRNRKIFSLLIMIGLLSCQVDNYDAPDAGLRGVIIDKNTGMPVPQPVVSDVGLKVRLVESNSNRATPIDFYANQYGEFVNTKVFSGPYKLFFEQINFLPIDTIDVDINGQLDLGKILVEPYCRLKIDEAVMIDSLIKVSISLNREWDKALLPEYKITDCTLYWNVVEGIDGSNGNNQGYHIRSLSSVPDSLILK